MELKAGAVVNKRLRLVRPIGKGGMGAVWVAFHEALKTEVAVKFVTGEAKDSDKMVARFEREAAIAAKLKSPHVAPTYDHGLTDDGTPFIVMELLEGESLQKRLERGPLSLHETALVVSQTAQALGKAHKLGIIHRDVKPANLFLLDTDYELFVKLLDFGIAKLADPTSESELTKTGSVMGSLLYMSPEQLTEVKNVDGRTDLWALAVVAYRCLATVPPFTGDAIGNVMMAIMERDYRPITVVRGELPSALDDWFAQAFAPDIEARFQTAKEMGKALRTIARDAPDNGDRLTADVLPGRLSQEIPPSETPSAALEDTALADGPDAARTRITDETQGDRDEAKTRITDGDDGAQGSDGARDDADEAKTRITDSDGESDAGADSQKGTAQADAAEADDAQDAAESDDTRDAADDEDAPDSAPSLPPLTAVRSDKELAASTSVWADESTLMPTTLDEASRKRRTGVFAAVAALVVATGGVLYATSGDDTPGGSAAAASASAAASTRAGANATAPVVTPSASASSNAAAGSASASASTPNAIPLPKGPLPAPTSSGEIDRSYPVPEEDDDIYR